MFQAQEDKRRVGDGRGPDAFRGGRGRVARSVHLLNEAAAVVAATATLALPVVMRLAVVARQLFTGGNPAQRVKFDMRSEDSHVEVGAAGVIDKGKLVAATLGIYGCAVVELDDGHALAPLRATTRRCSTDALARQFANLSSGGQTRPGKQPLAVNLARPDAEFRAEFRVELRRACISLPLHKFFEALFCPACSSLLIRALAHSVWRTKLPLVSLDKAMDESCAAETL
jgi:hypothetical protein